jgi:beta-glucosidase
MYANGVGMINPAFDETMEQTIERRNKLQNYLRNKTRLGIPVIFIDEAHHGLVQRNVDVFPHGIGLASSWDTALLTRIYDYIARQASSRGTKLVLAPVVDVVRDPRWGRTGECYGEDPFLNGVLGSAVVKGFQGSTNGIIAPNHVAATLKHFTGHGQPESGNNTGPANYSIRALREYHMEPFRYIVEKSKPSCIMASYVEVDEIPSHANKWLLTDVLRKEWNYKGIVVSDWFGIDQLRDKHQFATDLKDAAMKAFNAGVNVDLPYGINYVNLTQLVKEGKVSLKAIDDAVSNVLRVKFQMGLFEAKDIDVNEALAFNKKTEGRALALKIAEESMILLKNQPFDTADSDKPLLPIKKDQYKKIAVVGPFGAINLLGDYSGVPSKNVNIVEALKNKLGNSAQVVYAQGCKVTTNGDSISQNNYQFIDLPKFPTKEENQKLIDEAVNVAKNSDFIVVAVGENEQFSREAWNGHPGDMTDLNLQSQQEDLVKAIAATGKPYVVYLMHGRPLSINWIANNAPAIVDGWFTGEESGNAFANILFGDVNPSGKLTISVPRSVGQIPVYYNARPTSRFYDYVTEKNTPLYSFGYGLSYTTFNYWKPVMNGRNISIDVTNKGKMKGDEIVQLYIHQKTGESVVRPVKELKGFQRITLEPGQTKTVSFTITDDLLKHWTADMNYAVEHGVYEIMIGKNSNDLQKVELTIK